jgi:hypothetical protein
LSIKKLLERFSDFQGAELRSLEIISPTEITLSMALQDAARDFDWVTLHLHFSGVSDARVVENKKLPFIDTSNKMALLQKDAYIAFASSECYNIEELKNQTLYIIAKTLKTSESAF